MRPLFKSSNKNYDEFHLKEMIYVPNTVTDWLILSAMVLVFIMIAFVINHSFFMYQKETNNSITKAEQTEIKAFEHLNNSTFFHYLVGTWETMNGEYWSISFLKDNSGIIKIYNNGMNNAPIVIRIVVINTNPSLGVINFYNEDSPSEMGTIAKIWNRDAIEVNYPTFKKPVLLYFALLDLSSKPN